MKIKISLLYYFTCSLFFECQLKYLDYANCDHNTINGYSLNLKKVSDCLNFKDTFEFRLSNNMEYSNNEKSSILFDEDQTYLHIMQDGYMEFKQINVSSKGKSTKRKFGNMNNEHYCIDVIERGDNKQIMQIYSLKLPEKFTKTSNLRDNYINIDLNNGNDHTCRYNNDINSFIMNSISNDTKDNLIHYSDYFGNLDLLQNILQMKNGKEIFTKNMNEVISRKGNVKYELMDLHCCTVANPKEANKEYLLLILTLNLSFGIGNNSIQVHCFSLFDGVNIRLLHISDYVTSERADLNLYSIERVNSLLDKVAIKCVSNINYAHDNQQSSPHIAVLNLKWEDPSRNNETYIDIPYVKEIPGLRDVAFINVKTPEKKDHNENIKLLIIRENPVDKRVEMLSIIGNINKGVDIGRIGITNSKDFIDSTGYSIDSNSKYSDCNYMFLSNNLLTQSKDFTKKCLITLNEIESVPNKIR